MGAGNWFPSRNAYNLMYIDLDSSYLSLPDFRKLQEDNPEIYGEMSYETYLQEGYEQEYETTVDMLRDAGNHLTGIGIPVINLRNHDRNAFENKDWLTPIFEIGMVRLACKEVEISKLAVVAYTLDAEGEGGDLDELTAREFRVEYGMTRERYITVSGLQMDALDLWVLCYSEAQYNAVTAKTVSRRSCAWTSSTVTADAVLSLKQAAVKLRRALRGGQPRRRLDRQAA